MRFFSAFVKNTYQQKKGRLFNGLTVKSENREMPMLSGKDKELEKILELNRNNKILEASQRLSEYENKNHQTEIKIRIQIVKAFLVSPEQNWEKSLAIIEDVIPKCESLNNAILLLDALYVKSQCLSWGEQYKKSNIVIEESMQFLEGKLDSTENEFKLRIGWLFYLKGYNFNMMGENKLARETANHSLTIATDLNNTIILLNLYELLGNNELQAAKAKEAIIYYSTGLQLAEEVNSNRYRQLYCFRLTEGYGGIGDVEQSMKYCDLTIKLMKRNKQDPTQMIYFKAYLFYNLGEWDKAIPLAKEALLVLGKDTSLWGRALYLDGKAVIERLEGTLDKAIEYLNEAIELVLKRDDIFRSMVLSVRLVPMLFDKGEFDKALEVCFACLESFEKNNNVSYQASVFKTMGRIFHVKGDYNLAIDYIQKSLKIFIFPFERALSFFNLVQIAVDKHNKDLYNYNLNELEAIYNKHPTLIFEKMYQTAQALVLKASSRPRDWMKAIDLFIEVVNEKLTKHDFTLVALINLCELLINEYSISGDHDVLKELEFYVGELTELAKIQDIRHLRLEANNLQILAHWLKAQQSVVEFDFQKAKSLLERTRKIADEEGLLNLAEKMTHQQDRLLKQLSKWDDFIRKYYEFIKD